MRKRSVLPPIECHQAKPMHSKRRLTGLVLANLERTIIKLFENFGDSGVFRVGSKPELQTPNFRV